MHMGNRLAHILPSNTFLRDSKPIPLFNKDRIVVPRFGTPKLLQSGPSNPMQPGASIRHEKRASLGKIYDQHAFAMSMHAWIHINTNLEPDTKPCGVKKSIAQGLLAFFPYSTSYWATLNPALFLGPDMFKNFFQPTGINPSLITHEHQTILCSHAPDH